MISKIKRTHNPGAIYLVNEDITRCHISDNPTNGKTLHIGTPVVYIQTIQQTDCIVRDYTGQLWRLSRDDLDFNAVSEMPCKRELFLYKLPNILVSLGGIGADAFRLLFFISFFLYFLDALNLAGYMFLAFVICFVIKSISFCTREYLSETGKYHLYTSSENLRELEVLLNNSSSKSKPQW